jgi:predicted PurR-regulated permease PerM
MSSSSNSQTHWLVLLAASVVVLAGLKAAETIVVPVLLALFIGMISLPFLRLMISKGLPSGISILLLLSVLVLFGGSLAWVVSHSVDALMAKLPDYQTRLSILLHEIQPLIGHLPIPQDFAAMASEIKPANLMALVSGLLSMLSGLLANVFLVFFIVIFLLMEEAQFDEKLKRLQWNAAQATNFTKQTHHYLLIKTLVSIATGLSVTLLLWFLGVDFPVLWGLLALLMNFIPNIGSLIAAVPAVLLALVQLGIGDALWVMVGYLVINTFWGNFIEPRYMGKGLGLSPLVVFLSLIIWGWMFGLVGMFLSIPLTMILKIGLEQNPKTEAFALLLSDVSALPKR